MRAIAGRYRSRADPPRAGGDQRQQEPRREDPGDRAEDAVSQAGADGALTLLSLGSANSLVTLMLFAVIFFCWVLLWLITGYPIWMVVLGAFLGYAIYGTGDLLRFTPKGEAER